MLRSKERDKQFDRYLAQTFRHGHKTKNNRQLLLNVRFSLLRLGQQFSGAVNVPSVRQSVSQSDSKSVLINQSINQSSINHPSNTWIAGLVWQANSAVWPGNTVRLEGLFTKTASSKIENYLTLIKVLVNIYFTDFMLPTTDETLITA